MRIVTRFDAEADVVDGWKWRRKIQIMRRQMPMKKKYADHAQTASDVGRDADDSDRCR